MNDSIAKVGRKVAYLKRAILVEKQLAVLVAVLYILTLFTKGFSTTYLGCFLVLEVLLLASIIGANRKLVGLTN